MFSFLSFFCWGCSACTAERFFRVDRAQEHLHYVTDIANEIIYVLDQESVTLPQTPENEVASPASLNQPTASSLSDSSDNLDKQSPSSPNKKFVNRLSTSSDQCGTPDSLSVDRSFASGKRKFKKNK